MTLRLKNQLLLTNIHLLVSNFYIWITNFNYRKLISLANYISINNFIKRYFLRKTDILQYMTNSNDEDATVIHNLESIRIDLL